MGDMGVLGGVANKSAEKIINLSEQFAGLDFLAMLGDQSIGKLLGAFFFGLGHGLSPSVDLQCVVRFLPWRLRHSVRAVLRLPALSMQRVRARGRRA